MEDAEEAAEDDAAADEDAAAALAESPNAKLYFASRNPVGSFEYTLARKSGCRTTRTSSSACAPLHARVTILSSSLSSFSSAFSCNFAALRRAFSAAAATFASAFAAALEGEPAGERDGDDVTPASAGERDGTDAAFATAGTGEADAAKIEDGAAADVALGELCGRESGLG
jgi:hypothetical protein